MVIGFVDLKYFLIDKKGELQELKFKHDYKIWNCATITRMDDFGNHFPVKFYKNKKGYLRAFLKTTREKSNGFYEILLHRAVGFNFIPMIKDKYVINHKNFNKEDCSIQNLEWCTISENSEHSADHLRCGFLAGKDNPNFKYDNSIKRICSKIKYKEAKKLFGVSRTQHYRFKNGVRK